MTSRSPSLLGKLTRSAAALLSAIALLVVTPAAARAQDFDVLKCFTVDRTGWLPTSTTALSVSLPQVADSWFATPEGCTITRPRPFKVCVPAATVPPLDPSGQNLSTLYSCYRLRCPRQSLVPVERENALGGGTLTVVRGRGRTLCVPAI
jgi:hypothetical protein